MTDTTQPGALPPLVSRLAALGLLAGVVLAVAAFGVLPVMDRIRTTDQALEDDRALIGELQQRVAGRGAYGGQLDALKGRIAESGLYVRADTEPLAAAAVQERLKDAVGRHGGELRSVQSLPSEQEGALTKVGLRVVMTGQLEPAVRVLYELETSEPYLFVDNLQIQATARRRVQTGTEDGVNLSIRFDLFGYMPPEVGK